MKKILINAYTQFNLGDDLFIKILIEKYSKTNFIIFAPKEYKKVFAANNNLKVIPSDSFLVRLINYFFRKILNKNNLIKDIFAYMSDGIVHIGGSIFIQGDNWKENLEDYKKSIKKSRPYFLLGANFGPYTDEEYLLEHKKVLKNLTDVCFRDKVSFNLFKECSNVRLADDVIFQLKVDESIKKENNIIISVIKPSYRDYLCNMDERYYNKMKEVIDFIIDLGFEVTLISFCEREGDEEAVNEIIKLVSKENLKKVHVCFYKRSTKEVLELFSSARLIIATRFHSMILGWLFNKPVFPVIYSEKMLNVINDTKYNGDYVDIENIDNLLPIQVTDSLTNLPLDVSKHKKGAAKQFEVLDKYLL